MSAFPRGPHGRAIGGNRSPLPEEPLHLALLGMGRLARSLAPLLELAGHRVTRWRRGDPQPRADLCWITASDDAVPELAAWLEPGPVVLHASGGLDHAVLRPHRPAGSLHPLQTFPGPELGTPPLQGAPAAVAGDPEAVRAAERIARDLGMRPFAVPGDRRLYHAACVLAGNFTTVLLAEASRLLESAGVEEDPLELLLPLVNASIDGALRHGPRAAITGPAARGDERTIHSQLEALAETHPELLPLYRALTERARPPR
jgi:predicted short-subunit dehydrogenase-like oxidoreductase (DUF2520 family)